MLADYSRPDCAVVGVEFCGTSISSHSSQTDSSAAQLARNPHFIFADAHHRGYGLAHLGPKTLEVELRGLDDVTRQDAAVSTLASFRVQAGSSRLERVG